MWFNEAVLYHIYPLGFCGAPHENDGLTVNRIKKVIDWIPHLKNQNISAVYFSPVFESDRHGYDTRDYKTIDCRLGTNEDFTAVAAALHENGIRIILDGVYNHVGRGFWAFLDVMKNREASLYKDWFYIDFGGNNGYNDGLWYEGWEGHFELVKLNLENPAVVEHILDSIAFYIDSWDIDGLRLDVAYSLPDHFMRRLNSFCKSKKAGFYLLGEMIHGDYNRIVNPEMLDSATNYECYKGLYSSFNALNMFEISYSLNRQFGEEQWTLYKGKQLVCFADNHDVTRIYSILEDKNHIYPLYTVLFTMPGTPCIYYGSEWGAIGEKRKGDDDLRPCFEKPEENEISHFAALLSKIKTGSRALSYGSFKNETVRNKQWIFSRSIEDEKVIIAVNAENAEVSVECNVHGDALNLILGDRESLSGQISLKPYESKILKL